MSQPLKIIEGTSEQILERWSELLGHHLKVIVTDDLAGKAADHAVDDLWVKNLKDWAYNRPATTATLDDSRETLYEDRLR